ncbi:hypothetical protein QT970_02405 [Microcoleus sp. herbarium8]
MEQFIYPTLSAFFTALIAWIFTKRKNRVDLKLAEIDVEVKSAHFYKALLDDLKTRLEGAITAIEERDKRIAERDTKIEERDKRIDVLLLEVERLTDELRKFKQLNGKVN